MGFLHQLQLLLWKNVTLKRRSPVSDPHPILRGPQAARPICRCAPSVHVQCPGARRPWEAATGDPVPGPLLPRASRPRAAASAVPSSADTRNARLSHGPAPFAALSGRLGWGRVVPGLQLWRGPGSWDRVLAGAHHSA